MVCGVYVIRHRNGTPDACYVGSSVDINRRWEQHVDALCRGLHPNHRLQAAWCAYGGAPAFDFQVLREIKFNPTFDVTPLLLREEQKWMDYWSSQYNIAPALGSDDGIERPSSNARLLERALKDAVRRKSLIGARDLVDIDAFESEFIPLNLSLSGREPAWFVMRYVSGKEKSVHRLLDFIKLPYKRLAYIQKARRSRPIERFWLPGYIFCEFDRAKDNWGQVLRIPYVLDVLGKPTPLPTGLVDDLVLRLPGDVLKPSAFTCVSIGARVRIRKGAYEGHEAAVIWSDRKKLKVILMVFNRPTDVELSARDVEIV